MPEEPHDAIADTSPLQYLFQAGILHLLPLLYTTVVVPPAVVDELARGRARGVVLPDLDACPWIEVRQVGDPKLLPLVTHLGHGEREVIALSLEAPGSVALLDDGYARRHAKLVGVRVSGILGLLLKAKAVGHLDRIAPVIDRLQALGFHLDAGTRADVLDLGGE